MGPGATSAPVALGSRDVVENGVGGPGHRIALDGRFEKKGLPMGRWAEGREGGSQLAVRAERRQGVLKRRSVAAKDDRPAKCSAF